LLADSTYHVALNGIDPIAGFFLSEGINQTTINMAANKLLNQFSLLNTSANNMHGYGHAYQQQAILSIAIALSMNAFGDIWPESVWKAFLDPVWIGTLVRGIQGELIANPYEYSNWSGHLAAAMAPIANVVDNKNYSSYAFKNINDLFTHVVNYGIMEYNTNQYYLFELSAMESVVYFAKDPTIAAMAKALVEMQWATMAAAYWPPVPGKMIGPHDRSYRWHYGEGPTETYFGYYQFPGTDIPNQSFNPITGTEEWRSSYFYPHQNDLNSYTSGRFFLPSSLMSLVEMEYRVVRQRFRPNPGEEIYILITPSFSLSCSCSTLSQAQTYPVVLELPANFSWRGVGNYFGWQLQLRIMTWDMDWPLQPHTSNFSYFFYDLGIMTCVQELGTQLVNKLASPAGNAPADLTLSTNIWISNRADDVTINGFSLNLKQPYQRLALYEDSVVAVRYGRAALVYRVLYTTHLAGSAIKTVTRQPSNPIPYLSIPANASSPAPGKDHSHAYSVMFISGGMAGYVIWVPHKLKDEKSQRGERFPVAIATLPPSWTQTT